MRLTPLLGVALALTLGFTLVRALPASLGETRPRNGTHFMTMGSTPQSSLMSSTVPPVLSYLPAYQTHVKPILEANCVSCHVEGGIGPFALDSYQDARDHARAVYLATRSRAMPPFPPSGESPRFQHELRLSDDEIAILANWSWIGAPEGKVAAASAAAPRAVPRVRADLTLDTGHDFNPNPALSDEYRCFILETNLSTDRFVSGYALLPGNRKVVHHVLLFELPPAALVEARNLERSETDGRGGYTCFGGPRVSGGLQPIGAWAPGGADVSFPSGTGARLRAGSKLLVQVHYNLANGGAADRTRVALELAPEGSKLRPLQTFGPVAPVEIACAGPTPSDPSNPCSREAAYARVLQLNNSNGNRRRQAGRDLTQCAQALESFKNPVDVTRIATSCEYFSPARLTIYGLAGHMHYLGKSIKIEVLRPNGARQVLLDIPRWDFHWQGFYWLQQPVSLSRGDKVRISCVFDNSRANQPYLNGEQRAPRYIVWGEGTGEEMCLSYVQATVDGI